MPEAPALPTYQDAQPVISPQNVTSAGEGDEDLATSLGKMAEDASNVATKMEDNESQSMYINAVSNIEQVKSASQMRMIANPGEANRIADDMQTATDTISQNAFVNSEDRNKLKLYAETSNDDIQVKSAETNLQQTQRSAAFTHYANLPDQFKALQDAFISGDQDQVDNIKSGMMSNLNNLVMIGAIRPEQAGGTIKSMAQMTHAGIGYGKLVSNANGASAQDYHTVRAGLINPSPQDNANHPIDGNTQWLIDTYNGDKTFQDVKADISNGILPSGQSYYSLKPEQQDEITEMKAGKEAADGIINSGQSFPAIQSMLTNSKDQILNGRDTETRQSLQQYVTDLKNGNYLSVVGRTPDGSAIMQNYIQSNAAVDASAVSDQQKQQLKLQNRNTMVNQLVSYGQGRHIPSDLIKPIPSTDLANMQNGFTLGQDPRVVLNTLGQYSQGNQVYVANALKDPLQRFSANTVSLSTGQASSETQLNFLAAQQKGRDYSDIDKDADQQSLNDQKIGNLLATQLNPQAKLFIAQDGTSNGAVNQQQMFKAGINYVKYQAQINSDFNLKNINDYVNQASNLFKQAHPAQAGMNYVYNTNQLKLSQQDADALFSYANNQGFSKLHNDLGSIKYGALKLLMGNPLNSTLTSTGQIVSQDSNGTAIWSAPYSQRLLNTAKLRAKQLRDDPSLYQLMTDPAASGGENYFVNDITPPANRSK